jgi:hypothetical protein
VAAEPVAQQEAAVAAEPASRTGAGCLRMTKSRWRSPNCRPLPGCFPDCGDQIGLMFKCRRCQDARWVCENHPDRPWGHHPDDCCGGAGMPCPDCNAVKGERPKMSADFVPALDRDKGPIH